MEEISENKDIIFLQSSLGYLQDKNYLFSNAGSNMIPNCLYNLAPIHIKQIDLHCKATIIVNIAKIPRYLIS
eukprot:snap_masked-scaffold_21-processed-gene-1.20-mRNA-1 protein AED:1.00 eAED:1.00 QI:0/0/0/0/1/1/3/0/71